MRDDISANSAATIRRARWRSACLMVFMVSSS
jgi:hypothetical protein